MIQETEQSDPFDIKGPNDLPAPVRAGLREYRDVAPLERDDSRLGHWERVRDERIEAQAPVQGYQASSELRQAAIAYSPTSASFNERVGLIGAQRDGNVTEFLQGFAGSSVDVARSVLETGAQLGIVGRGAVDSVEAWQEMNQHLAMYEGAKPFSSWGGFWGSAGAGLGSRVPQIAVGVLMAKFGSVLGVGALGMKALGYTGTSLSMGSMYLGDNIKFLNEEAGLPRSESIALAFAQTVLQTGVQMVMGAERRIVDVTTRGMALNTIRQAGMNAASKEAVSRTSRELVVNKIMGHSRMQLGLLANMGVSITGEGFAEVGALFVEDMFRRNHREQQFHSFQEYFDTFVSVVPSMLLMGAAGQYRAHRNKVMVDEILKPMTQVEVNTAAQSYSPQVMQAFEQNIGRLRNEFIEIGQKTGMGDPVAGADAAARIIGSFSLKSAMALDRHDGRRVDPNDFVEGFRTRFAEKNITADDFAKIEKMGTEQAYNWLADNGFFDVIDQQRTRNDAEDATNVEADIRRDMSITIDRLNAPERLETYVNRTVELGQMDAVDVEEVVHSRVARPSTTADANAEGVIPVPRTTLTPYMEARATVDPVIYRVGEQYYALRRLTNGEFGLVPTQAGEAKGPSQERVAEIMQGRETPIEAEVPVEGDTAEAQRERREQAEQDADQGRRMDKALNELDGATRNLDESWSEENSAALDQLESALTERNAGRVAELVNILKKKARSARKKLKRAQQDAQETTPKTAQEALAETLNNYGTALANASKAQREGKAAELGRDEERRKKSLADLPEMGEQGDTGVRAGELMSDFQREAIDRGKVHPTYPEFVDYQDTYVLDPSKLPEGAIPHSDMQGYFSQSPDGQWQSVFMDLDGIVKVVPSDPPDTGVRAMTTPSPRLGDLQARLDALPTMAAKQAALDAWKADPKNAEAVREAEGGGKAFTGFRGGRTGPFRAELTKPTYRKDEQLGFGIHIAKDEPFARLYAEDNRTARKGSEPITEPTEVVMNNPLESRVVVTEADALWGLVKQLAPRGYRFPKDRGKDAIWLQNAIDLAAPQKAERVLREAGYDGVIYDATVRGGINPMTKGVDVSGKSESYVVFDPSQVRTGQAMQGQSPSPLSLTPDGRLAGMDSGVRAMTTPVTPQQDAAYLQAVESGDMEAAQKMVDEAADGNWGVYRGKPFFSGVVSLLDGRVEEVHTNQEAEAAGNHHRNYVGIGAVERIDAGESAFFIVNRSGEKVEVTDVWDDIPSGIIGDIKKQVEVRSADAITRYTAEDAAVKEGRAKVGDPIPPSQRFQAESQDIRRMEGDGQTEGLYFSSNATAVFFGSATPATFVHEFFHHVQAKGLMPSPLQNALNKSFGHIENTRDREEAEAMAFTRYMLERELPEGADPKLAEAFTYMKNVGTGVYDRIKSEWELPKQTINQLDKLFTSEDFQYSGVADAVTEGMVSESGVRAMRHPERKNFHIIKNKLAKKLNMTDDQMRAMLEGAFGKGYILAKDDKSGRQTEDMSTEELSEAIVWMGQKWDGRMSPKDFAIVKEAIATRDEERKKDIRNVLAGQADEFRGKVAEQYATMPDRVQDRADGEGGLYMLRKLMGGLQRRGARYLAGTSTYWNLAKLLDGGKEGVFSKEINPRIVQGQNEVQIRYDAIQDKMRATTEALRKKHSVGLPADFNMNVQVGGTTMDVGRVAFVYMVSEGGNTGAKWAQNLMQRNDEVTPKLIQDAKKFMESSEGREFLNYVEVTQDIFADLYDDLSATADALGYSIGKIGRWYVPFMSEDNFQSNNEWNNLLERLNPKEQGATGTRRVAQTKERVDLTDMDARNAQDMIGQIGRIDMKLDTLVPRYIESSVNYVAKAENTRYMLRMLSDGGVRNMAARKGLTPYLKQLEDLIGGEMFPSGRRLHMTDGEQSLRTIRNAATISLLGYNPATFIRQTASLPIGLADYATNTRPVLSALDNYFKAMGHGGVKGVLQSDPLKGLAHYDEMITDHPRFKSRYVVPDIQDMASRGGPLGMGPMRGKGSWFDKYTKNATNHIRYMDSAVVSSIYKSAKDYKMAALADVVHAGEMSLAGAEAEAKRWAGEVVDRTQPPTNISQRTGFQRGSEFMRAFLPFSGQTMVSWNYYMHDVVFPMMDDVRGAQGVMGKSAKVLKTLYDHKRQMFFSWMVPAMMFGLIARRRLPEDPQEVFVDLLMYPFGVVPLIGRIAQATVSGKYRDYSYDPTMVGVLGRSVTHTVNASFDTIFGDKEWSWYDSNQVRRGLSIMTGTPEWSTRVLSNFVEEMNKGQWKDDPEVGKRFMRMVGMGVEPSKKD